MTSTVDLSLLASSKLWEAVNDVESSTWWAVMGVSDVGAAGGQVYVQATGDAPLPKMVEQLKADQLQFAILRILGVDPRGGVRSVRLKTVFISWVGANVPFKARGRARELCKGISSHFTGAALHLEVHDADEVTVGDLEKRLRACGGAHQPDHYEFPAGSELREWSIDEQPVLGAAGAAGAAATAAGGAAGAAGEAAAEVEASTGEAPAARAAEAAAPTAVPAAAAAPVVTPVPAPAAAAAGCTGGSAPIEAATPLAAAAASSVVRVVSVESRSAVTPGVASSPATVVVHGSADDAAGKALADRIAHLSVASSEGAAKDTAVGSTPAGSPPRLMADAPEAAAAASESKPAQSANAPTGAAASSGEGAPEPATPALKVAPADAAAIRPPASSPETVQ